MNVIGNEAGPQTASMASLGHPCFTRASIEAMCLPAPESSIYSNVKVLDCESPCVAFAAHAGAVKTGAGVDSTREAFAVPVDNITLDLVIAAEAA